jgi:hypothetical protein
VLFSLVKTRMTEWWVTWMPALAAMSLAIGAALSVGSELHAYAARHVAQAVLAGVLIVVLVLFASVRFGRAIRAERRDARETRKSAPR